LLIAADSHGDSNSSPDSKQRRPGVARNAGSTGAESAYARPEKRKVTVPLAEGHQRCVTALDGYNNPQVNEHTTTLRFTFQAGHAGSIPVARSAKI
jgi:hypothetical protein